jgi:hypothetical protein
LVASFVQSKKKAGFGSTFDDLGCNTVQEVVGVFVRFRAPLQLSALGSPSSWLSTLCS